MDAITDALLPILVLILIGFLLRRLRFIPEPTWSGLERLTYYLLFPALLLHSLGSHRLTGVAWPELLLVVGVVISLSAALLLISYRFLPGLPGPTFTSIFQGGVRFNTYIALALCQAFLGDRGLALGAAAAGFMIVIINLLCIGVLSLWGNGASPSPGRLMREVAGNPLILSCLLGGTLNLTGIGLPGPTEAITEIVGRAALPLGLLAVGAALRPRAIRGHMTPILAASWVQFGLKPLATLVMVRLAGLDAISAGVLIILFMTPTAPSAYILARHLGGDSETMASIITLQTLLAFFVMPLFAYLFLPL